MDDTVTDEEFLENLRQEHDWYLPESEVENEIKCTCGFIPESEKEMDQHEAETPSPTSNL
jgi:hypothetical protein